MSWSETKKLADVITSNVVPSENIVVGVGSNQSTTITGCGFCGVYANYDNYGSAKIVVDEDKTHNVPNGSNALWIKFNKKITLSASVASSSHSASVKATVFLYDRQSLVGGGGKVVNLFPVRKAVAA